MGILDGLFGRKSSKAVPTSGWSKPFVQYWDQNTDSINRNALELGRLDKSGRVAACNIIRDSVRQSAAGWSDDLVLRAAVSMTDDLYKCMNDTKFDGDTVFEYLDAFGRTFTNAVSARGFAIQYVAENTFSGIDFLMIGPFDWFSKVFSAAGFVYICPQKLAFELMQADGLAATDYEDSLSQYIAEARMVGRRLVTKCRSDSRHYVFLETDYEDGSLDAALEGRGDQAVVSVFRNQAPLPGSEVEAVFPDLKQTG